MSLGSHRLPADQRRRQLIDTARRVFARRGFHQTSMNDVALQAGVTKPVLYQHFASKRDLYQAVLEDVGRRLQDGVIIAAARAGSPREAVEVGFEAYLAFVEDDPDGFTVLFGGASRDDEEWARIGAAVEQSVADGIADLIAVEGMSDAHRHALAHGMVGLAEGMVRYWRRCPDLDRDELARDLTALAWAGLRGLRAD
jgi:AcrR family transcriptional regulator